MSNPLKIALSLMLLAAIGSTGCDKSSTTEIEADAATAETEVTTIESPAAPQTSPEESESSESAKAKPQTLAEMMQERMKPEVVGPALEEGFAKVQESIAAITDEASATEALPKFREFFKRVDQMVSMAPLVPAETRPVVAEKLSAAIGPLQEALDKLFENEDIKATLQPITDKIMNELSTLSDKVQPTPPAEDASEEESTPADEEAETDEESPTEEAETDEEAPAEEAETASGE